MNVAGESCRLVENGKHVSHKDLDGAQNVPPRRLTGIILFENRARSEQDISPSQAAIGSAGLGLGLLKATPMAERAEAARKCAILDRHAQPARISSGSMPTIDRTEFERLILEIDRVGCSRPSTSTRSSSPRIQPSRLSTAKSYKLSEIQVRYVEHYHRGRNPQGRPGHIQTIDVGDGRVRRVGRPSRWPLGLVRPFTVSAAWPAFARRGRAWTPTHRSYGLPPEAALPSFREPFLASVAVSGHSARFGQVPAIVSSALSGLRFA